MTRKPGARSSRLTRRVFLAATSAVSIAALTGCGGGGGGTDPVVPDPSGPAVAFRLSTRGVDTASNAAKANAANKRFATAAAADAGRAHPGDNARIVTINVSQATWEAWFGGGAQVVDLRAL